MRARTIILAALLLIAGLAPVAVAHDGNGPTTHVYDTDDVSDVYQDDGGSGEDAADDCHEALVEEDIELLPGGGFDRGELLPGLEPSADAGGPGDVHDFWRMPVDGSADGFGVVEGWAETPIELREPLRFNVTVTVLDPGCVPLAEDTTHATGYFEVKFPIDQLGVYRVGLEIQPSSLDLPGELYDPLVPANGHCSPYCFQYMMGASS